MKANKVIAGMGKQAADLGAAVVPGTIPYHGIPMPPPPTTTPYDDMDQSIYAAIATTTNAPRAGIDHDGHEASTETKVGKNRGT